MLWQKIKDTFDELKSLFFSGLFTIIPIGATLFFINFFYTFVAKILEPLRQVEPDFLQAIPGTEIVLILCVIILMGVILRFFVAKQLVHYFEHLVIKIPLVRMVYSSAKIVVDFFKVSDKKLIQQRKVVLIPYPKKGQYHLAFLLESAEDTYQEIIPEHLKAYPDEKYSKVFMPNSPNPTSGYFFIMPNDEIIHTQITFEEAIKTLVSCGLVTPESLKHLKK